MDQPVHTPCQVSRRRAKEKRESGKDIYLHRSPFTDPLTNSIDHAGLRHTTDSVELVHREGGNIRQI